VPTTEPGLRRRGRTQRAPDGQLASPLDLRVGQHRVQPRQAERERRGGEQLQQLDPGAPGGEDTLEKRLPALNRGDRDVGVDRVDALAQLPSKTGADPLGADEHRQPGGEQGRTRSGTW
jgi:hypothetical protein